MTIRKELKVRLTANADQYNSQMKRASDTTERFSTKVSKGVTAAAGAFVKFAPAVGAASAAMAVFNGISRADDIAKLSRRLGISTEALSRLGFAAKSTGVEFSTLTMGLQRMTRRISEAAQGSGEAKDAIRELGLDAQRLNQLAPEKQFALIADAMEGVSNQSDRVRLSMKLFDSEGVALIQTMEGGSRALDEFSRKSDQLGNTLSAEQAAKAEDAQEAIDELSAAFVGLNTQLSVAVIPVLTAVTDGLTSIIEQANKLPGVFDNVAIAGRYLNEQIGLAPEGSTEALVRSLKPELFGDDASGAANDNAQPDAESVAANFGGVIPSPVNKPDSPDAESVAAKFSGLIPTPEEQSIVEQYRSEELERIRTHEAEITSIRNQFAAERLGQIFNFADQELSIFDSMFQNMEKGQARNFGAMMNNFGQFAQQSQKGAKALGLAMMAIDMFKAIQGAYAFGSSIGGPPVGAAMASLAAAASVSNINKLKSQQYSANQNSFSAPSPASASPNTTQGQIEQARSAPQQTTRNLNINVRNRSGIFTKEDVRDLITSINEELGEGAQLNVGFG